MNIDRGNLRKLQKNNRQIPRAATLIRSPFRANNPNPTFPIPKLSTKEHAKTIESKIPSSTLQSSWPQRNRQKNATRDSRSRTCINILRK
jgi:hypothetical protein